MKRPDLPINSLALQRGGIAPFYSDKYAKTGIQICDLFYPEILRERIENACTIKNVLLENLYHMPKLDPEKIYNEVIGYRDIVEPYIANTEEYLFNAVKEGKNILLEGQLARLKTLTTAFTL